MIANGFDPEVIIELLASIPTDDLDVQNYGALIHARLVVLAAQDGNIDHMNIARYALSRLMTLLEQQAAVGVSPLD